MKKLKEMQNSLSQISKSHQENGVKVTINGKMEVEEVQLNENLSALEQEKAAKTCMNEALKKIRTEVAKEMQGQM